MTKEELESPEFLKELNGRETPRDRLKLLQEKFDTKDVIIIVSPGGGEITLYKDSAPLLIVSDEIFNKPAMVKYEDILEFLRTK